MAHETRLRSVLERDLRGAAGRGELQAYLQPIVEIASGAVQGYEALLRWRHPDLGLLAPNAFIPIAEESGLIVPIGEWMLNVVCALMAGSPPELFVSVNLSPVQFRARTIVQTVKDALESAGLPAERLVLEITETVLLMDDAYTIETLRELRGMGVRIALDDFGTGHSSLSYLQKFCFDTIKIDRSFVNSADGKVNPVLLRTIIALGAELGISVIAEGVETEGQRSNLVSYGARLAQGYLFGRPHPAEYYISPISAEAPSRRLAAAS